MKHHNITLSFSKSLFDDLHIFVKKRGISRFVEEAVSEKLKAKKQDLEQHYKEAANDIERNKVFREWDQLAGDGLNEQNDW